MDTKERKPPKRRQSPAAQPRRRASHAGRTGTVSAKSRKRPVSGATRTIRPPREEIPEVVYTMPKPFRKGSFLLKLLSVAAVAVAAVFAVSLFLRVDTVRVAGMDKYTPWMVREASGVQEGDALLGLNKAKMAGRLTSKLPYVDKVKIGISLPGTVNIEITELKVTYAVESSDGTWWLVNAQGRVVEQIDPAQAAAYPRILGVKAEAPAPGEMIQQASGDAAQETEDSEQPEETTEEIPEETTEEAADEEPEQTQEPSTATEPEQTQPPSADRMQTALELAAYAEQTEAFGYITAIDVTDLSNLSVSCGDRLRIRLGNADRLEYKVGYMAQALRQLSGNEEGELDVSFTLSEEAILRRRNDGTNSQQNLSEKYVFSIDLRGISR